MLLTVKSDTARTGCKGERETDRETDRQRERERRKGEMLSNREERAYANDKERFFNY